MAIATINRFISLFTDAFRELSVNVPVVDVERMAMLIHHSMDHGRRTYHTSTHVFDMCEGMNPRQVLSTLFHDIVYYQLDGGFPKSAEALLKRVVRVERDVLEVRPVDSSDKGYTICTGIFGFQAGQALPLYGGMNEFLSAMVAIRTLEPYLPMEDIVAIVACIESTIPFRISNAAGRDMLDVLADRVSDVSVAVGLQLPAAEITRIVSDAAVLSNQDVSSFSEADPGRFLSTTWLLIEESNAPLAAVGIYSIQEYRGALSRMEKFLGSLNPDSIFHSYKGAPGEFEFGVLRAAARRNVEFACKYLGMKIAGIAIVEALALATGGDCPVSMLLGDIRSPYGKPDRVEDFLPPPPATDESKLDAQLLGVLEKGRAKESASDLTSSPLTAFVYRSLGNDGAIRALEQAKKMFAGELTARDFLGGLEREMVRTLTQACAHIAVSRREALLALVQSVWSAASRNTMRWLPKLTVGTVATFAAVFTGILLYVVEPTALKVLRNIVFDQYQRWHPRTYQAVPVRIIDFDDESLKRIGQWPWPRTTIADLINRLRDAGAVSIGFDVIFAEEDRTSPKSMVDIWSAKGDVRERLLAIPDHDQVMAQALKQGAVVLGFAGTSNVANAKMPTMRSSVVNLGESALPYLHPFSGAVTSLELLERAATGVGSLSFVSDLDGVVRRVPLMVRVRDKIMPSLVSESLRVGLGQRNYNVKTSVKKEVGVQEIRIGKLVIPTTREGELWVHYTRPVPQRTIPAWQIFEGKYPQGSLDGYVALVGTSAQGLMDLRSSPMGTIMPGIEAHAQALEQILTDKYLERPTWATVFEAFILIVGGLIIGIVALTTRALVSAGFTAALIACGLFAAWRAFTVDGLLFDPVTPSLALLITFILGSVIKHMNSEREQRWVREAFSRYVSPNRVDYLVDNPGQLELGGRRQECSFVFTDLEDFTGLMEKMDPGAAVALLNAYLDRMVAIAFASGGTLDRIVGDAVAIMFSAPVLQPDHRERAYKCALEMHAFASSYSAALEAEGTPFGKTRIGVHTGEVIVGNFGGSTMFDYRALGDPVNTAARLEGVNKHLGTTVCVSEATLSGCPGAIVRPVGRLVLKGKTQELMVYEPIAAAGTGATGRDADYDAAFDLLRQGSPQALPAFEQLAHAREHDALVSLHLGRLRAGEQYDRIVLDEK